MMAKNVFIELLPCPFCGGLPYLNVIPPHKHHITIAGIKMPDSEGCAFVECSCGAAIAGDDREEAIRKWNRRAK